MNIDEVLITGYDGAAIVFAATLTAADGAEVLRPGTSAEGEPVVDEAWEKATDAFTAWWKSRQP